MGDRSRDGGSDGKKTDVVLRSRSVGIKFAAKWVSGKVVLTRNDPGLTASIVPSVNSRASPQRQLRADFREDVRSCGGPIWQLVRTKIATNQHSQTTKSRAKKYPPPTLLKLRDADGDNALRRVSILSVLAEKTVTTTL